ncbi:HIT domain [Streptococcus massiliensis]|uniref:HIT domain n=1 Tax=Streptococcus massiliensis TaxID=313439 RepID=A0A380L201_9STRE|nr:HIT domain [Streptococcus massiliensis]
MMDKSCVFCSQATPLLENELALAFFDQSPVSPGHLLIIPKVHRQDYFDCSKEELAAINDLTR